MENQWPKKLAPCDNYYDRMENGCKKIKRLLQQWKLPEPPYNLLTQLDYITGCYYRVAVRKHELN